MALAILNRLKERWEQSVQRRASELESTMMPIKQGLEASGIRISVWRNLGSNESEKGIRVDGFLGYSEVNGVWRLAIRTIERDEQTGSVISSKVEELTPENPFIEKAVGQIRQLLTDLDRVVDSQVKGMIAAQNIAIQILGDDI